MPAVATFIYSNMSSLFAARLICLSPLNRCSLSFSLSRLLALSVLSFCLCHLLLSSVTLGCPHSSVCLSICLHGLTSLSHSGLLLLSFSNAHSDSFFDLCSLLLHLFSLSLSPSHADCGLSAEAGRPDSLHTPRVLNRSQEAGDECTAL